MGCVSIIVDCILYTSIFNSLNGCRDLCKINGRSIRAIDVIVMDS